MAAGRLYGEAFCRGKRFAIEHERRNDTNKAEMLTSEGASLSVLNC
jgi:hypothetical protein